MNPVTSDYPYAQTPPYVAMNDPNNHIATLLKRSDSMHGRQPIRQELIRSSSNKYGPGEKMHKEQSSESSETPGFDYLPFNDSETHKVVPTQKKKGRFANLLKGAFGVFRKNSQSNQVAQEAKATNDKGKKGARNTYNGYYDESEDSAPDYVTEELDSSMGVEGAQKEKKQPDTPGANTKPLKGILKESSRVRYLPGEKEALDYILGGEPTDSSTANVGDTVASDSESGGYTEDTEENDSPSRSGASSSNNHANNVSSGEQTMVRMNVMTLRQKAIKNASEGNFGIAAKTVQVAIDLRECSGLVESNSSKHLLVDLGTLLRLAGRTTESTKQFEKAMRLGLSSEQIASTGMKMKSEIRNLQ